MAIHLSGPDDIRNISRVALGLKFVQDDRFHVGLIYRNVEDNLRWLHLAWHYILVDEAPPLDVAWSGFLNINDNIADLIVDACELAWEENKEKKIPYSFLNNKFAEDFSVSDDPGSGFTCATFVLGILENIGINLIDKATWKTRPDDSAWQDWVINMLRASRIIEKYGTVGTEHLEILERSIGVFRFRPLDLIAAADVTRPSTFSEIEARLPEIIAAVQPLVS